MRKKTKVIIVLTIILFIAATMIPSIGAAAASIAPKLDPKLQAAQHAKFVKASGSNPIVRWITKVPAIYKINRQVGIGIINHRHLKVNRSNAGNINNGSNQSIFANIIIGIKYDFR